MALLCFLKKCCWNCRVMRNCQFIPGVLQVHLGPLSHSRCSGMKGAVLSPEASLQSSHVKPHLRPKLLSAHTGKRVLWMLLSCQWAWIFVDVGCACTHTLLPVCHQLGGKAKLMPNFCLHSRRYWCRTWQLYSNPPFSSKAGQHVGENNLSWQLKFIALWVTYQNINVSETCALFYRYCPVSLCLVFVHCIAPYLASVSPTAGTRCGTDCCVAADQTSNCMSAHGNLLISQLAVRHSELLCSLGQQHSAFQEKNSAVLCR